MIRVLLADDQTLVRQGITGLLELTEDIRVVAQASDGDEVLAALERVRPDVLLLDVRMPRRTGIQVIESISSGGPPCLLLTTFDDDEALLGGVRAGARGWLLKDVSLETLSGAIRVVAAGGTLIQPALGERILRGLERLRTPAPASTHLVEPLTPRETEILRLLAGGYSNREVATALGTAEGTVKNQTSSILAKLGVRDRTRAVLKAIELGLI